MNVARFLIILLTVTAMHSIATAQATQPAPAAEEDDIIYRPPTASAGSARMGGGSRSDVKLPTIAALVPDHLALCGTPKPVLYWFCSEASTLPREFSLVDSQSLETIKRVKMDAPIEAGWQKIDLGELGVELTKDTAYEWRIALIASTTNRSDNAVAGGMIQYVIRPAVLIQEPPLKQVARLAGNGLWYDALHVVMDELDNDPSAAKVLARLLEQVKLDDAAKFAQK